MESDRENRGRAATAPPAAFLTDGASIPRVTPAAPVAATQPSLTTEQRRALGRNLPKSLFLAFFQVFMVFIPVAVPFFQSRGLDMREVLLLQAWFAAVIVVMEVPSGYVADMLGRKRSLVAGTLMLGLGFSVLVIAHSFPMLLVFEGLLGVGASLISGADLALLYDTELALGHGDGTPSAVRNLHVTQSLSEATAALLCSALMLVSLDAVVWVQVVVGWVPFLVAVSLVEPPVHRPRGDTPVNGLRMREVVTHMLVDDRVLRYTVLALSLWSLTTFYAVWLLQRYWEIGGVPLVWFGCLWAVCNAVSGVAGRWAAGVERALGAPTLLVLVGVLPALAYAALAGLPLVAALLFSLLFFLARGLGLVVLREAMNSRTPSHFRATANSLASFGFRGAYVVTAPIAGALLEGPGMTTTLWAMAAGSVVIVLFVLWPLARAVRRMQAMAASE